MRAAANPGAAVPSDAVGELAVVVVPEKVVLSLDCPGLVGLP